MNGDEDDDPEDSGGTGGWVWTLEGEEELDPSALESFAGLDAAGRDPRRAVAVNATTGCPRPYLEVRVRDAAGKPIAGAPCKLAFPAGGGRQEDTDETGLARFDGIDVEASTLVVRVFEESKDDRPPTYRVEVTTREEETASPEPEPSGDDEPLYYVELEDRDA
jgi:hypothetical protein